MSTEQSALDKPIKRKAVPEIVIGLERPIPKDPRDKTAFVRFSCRNDPNDPDSPTYELQVPYFESGTPAELLDLLEKVAAVHAGQDLTTGPERYSLMRRVLKGAAKTEFENSARDQGGNETVANYNAVIEMLKAKLFPTNALRDQKRALQKHLKKPHDMPMRAYASRMSELNELLLQFPPREPGLVATNFDEEEIIQCIEDGLPPYYKKFMREHGFQPVNGDLSDFIRFVTERIEPNDNEKPTKGKRKSATQSTNDNGQNGKKSQKRSNKKSKPQNGKDKTYWCTLCGEGDHSSNKCKEIQKFVAEKKSKNGNKKQFYHVEEVHAMLSNVAEESAAKAVKKVTKAWKKRSREEANAVDSPSTSSGSGTTIAKKLDVLEIDSSTTTSKSTLSS